MIFSLEAVEAKHGDALLLHYGPPKAPKLIVVDGGPAGVYQRTLRPRLEKLRKDRVGGEAALPIRLLLVSHIDDDHIRGVLDLVGEMVEAEADGETAPWSVLSLWHNSFDDLVEKLAGVRGAAALGGSAIAVSVPQGRTLRQHAKKLALSVNQPFETLVAPPGNLPKIVALGSGLDFIVLGPRRAQLEALQNEWAAKLAAARKKKRAGLSPAELAAAAAEFVDTSVANLSSIVVLAVAGGRRMLLTGDARGDFILEGLAAGKLMKQGECAVDLMKVPHHGSDRDVDESFFRKIPARHYVISADGRFENPDRRTFEYLFAARGNASYTIHMTNRVPRIESFLKQHKPAKVKVVYRDPEQPSLRVDLEEELA